MKYIIIMVISVMLISCNNVNDIPDRGDGTDQIGNVNDINKDLVELSGIIKEVYDNSVLIETVDNEPYVIHLMDDVNLEDFVVGYRLTIGFTGEVMESYPMQVNAKKIISVKKN